MGGKFQWPDLSIVVDYRRRVKELILRVIDETPLTLPITMDSPWVIYILYYILRYEDRTYIQTLQRTQNKMFTVKIVMFTYHFQVKYIYSLFLCHIVGAYDGHGARTNPHRNIISTYPTTPSLHGFHSRWLEDCTAKTW